MDDHVDGCLDTSVDHVQGLEQAGSPRQGPYLASIEQPRPHVTYTDLTRDAHLASLALITRP